LIFKKTTAFLVIIIAIFGGLLTPVFSFNLVQQPVFATPTKGETNAEVSGTLQSSEQKKGPFP
jgi:hypothetical protein